VAKKTRPPAPASADGRPWFDPDALRERAGDASFRRGEEYFRGGVVTLLSVEPARVLASVAGTEEYRSELTLRRDGIGGNCSCRAFEDWGFCKHLVAVGLAANAAAGESGEVGPFAAIRRHLEGMEVPALVAMVMELAERDPQLRQRLELLSTLSGGDDKAVASRLRRAITTATRTGEFVSYYEASDWADGVNEALAALSDVARTRPSLAVELAKYAMERIEDAVESLDDSDGHCSRLMAQARDIHLDACRAAKPDPVALARELFALETDDGYGFHDRSVATYAEVLGDAGLAEYRRLATAAWERIPPRKPREEHSHDHWVLTHILDFFAERDGDVDARIALRARDLSSQWSYVELARLCLESGRTEEALRRAEEGLWIFEDEAPDERLFFFAADLLVEAGRAPDAVAHLHRLFEKRPDVDVYGRLCKLGGEAARARAMAFLKQRAMKAVPSAWEYPADILLRILTMEKRYEDAWVVARAHSTPIQSREALARASEATHPAEAIETYAERVAGLVNSGTNPAYAEAAELVARMAMLRAPAEQAAYVADLKARFGRKRNFMKLLP
jgi:uncharacterized Zn finger protein